MSLPPLIADGTVKILNYSDDGNEIIKGILSKGEIAGELAILGEEKRSDFAQALDDKTSICQLNLDQMQDLMKEDQSFALKINKLIGLRIRKLERRLDSLVFKDVKTRLAFLIFYFHLIVHPIGSVSGTLIASPEVSSVNALSRSFTVAFTASLGLLTPLPSYTSSLFSLNT